MSAQDATLRMCALSTRIKSQTNQPDEHHRPRRWFRHAIYRSNLGVDTSVSCGHHDRQTKILEPRRVFQRRLLLIVPMASKRCHSIPTARVIDSSKFSASVEVSVNSRFPVTRPAVDDASVMFNSIVPLSETVRFPAELNVTLLPRDNIEPVLETSKDPVPAESVEPFSIVSFDPQSTSRRDTEVSDPLPNVTFDEPSCPRHQW